MVRLVIGVVRAESGQRAGHARVMRIAHAPVGSDFDVRVQRAAETLMRLGHIVDFVGLDRQAGGPRLAAECDAVFAYHAPTGEYNRRAGPNEIPEAQIVGRPVIINAETAMSRLATRLDSSPRLFATLYTAREVRR